MQSLVRALRPAVSHAVSLRAVACCEIPSPAGVSPLAAAVSAPFATTSRGECASPAAGLMAVGGAWGGLSPLWRGASGGCRTLTSSPAARGLEEFFDQEVGKKGEAPSAGTIVAHSGPRYSPCTRLQINIPSKARRCNIFSLHACTHGGDRVCTQTTRPDAHDMPMGVYTQDRAYTQANLQIAGKSNCT